MTNTEKKLKKQGLTTEAVETANYQMPRYYEGQAVQVAYAHYSTPEGCFTFMRSVDRSDNSVQYTVYRQSVRLNDAKHRNASEPPLGRHLLSWEDRTAYAHAF